MGLLGVVMLMVMLWEVRMDVASVLPKSNCGCLETDMQLRQRSLPES